MNILRLILVILLSGCASKLDFNDPVTFVPVVSFIKEEYDNKVAKEDQAKKLAQCLDANKKEADYLNRQTKGNCYKDKMQSTLIYAVQYDGEGVCQTQGEQADRFLQNKNKAIQILQNEAQDCDQLYAEEERRVQEARAQIKAYVKGVWDALIH